MVSFVLLSAVLSPALLCIGVLVVAMLQGGSLPPLGTLIQCYMVIAAAPLIAAALVQSLYRWCFEHKPPQAIGVLAALATLVYLLTDATYLSSLKDSFVSPEWTLLQIAPLFIQAMTTAIFTAALLVLGVLFIEVPIRWGMGTFGGSQRARVLKALRAIVLYLLIGAGWPVVRTLGGDILGDLLQLNTSALHQHSSPPPVDTHTANDALNAHPVDSEGAHGR